MTARRLSRLLALLLAFPVSAFSQWYTVTLDTQTPQDQQVIPRVFEGNTPYIRFVINENGEGKTLSNAWSMTFWNSRDENTATGVQIPGTWSSSNIVDFLGQTNTFFMAGKYYFSVLGIHDSGYVKTFGTGTMYQDYDPAADTNLQGQLSAISIAWWTNNIGAQVFSNQAAIVILNTGKVGVAEWQATNTDFQAQIDLKLDTSIYTAFTSSPPYDTTAEVNAKTGAVYTAIMAALPTGTNAEDLTFGNLDLARMSNALLEASDTYTGETNSGQTFLQSVYANEYGMITGFATSVSAGTGTTSTATSESQQGGYDNADALTNTVTYPNAFTSATIVVVASLATNVGELAHVEVMTVTKTNFTYSIETSGAPDTNGWLIAWQAAPTIAGIGTFSGTNTYADVWASSNNVWTGTNTFDEMIAGATGTTNALTENGLVDISTLLTAGTTADSNINLGATNSPTTGQMLFASGTSKTNLYFDDAPSGSGISAETATNIAEGVFNDPSMAAYEMTSSITVTATRTMGCELWLQVTNPTLTVSFDISTFPTNYAHTLGYAIWAGTNTVNADYSTIKSGAWANVSLSTNAWDDLIFRKGAFQTNFDVVQGRQ